MTATLATKFNKQVNANKIAVAKMMNIKKNATEEQQALIDKYAKDMAMTALGLSANVAGPHLDIRPARKMGKIHTSLVGTTNKDGVLIGMVTPTVAIEDEKGYMHAIPLDALRVIVHEVTKGKMSLDKPNQWPLVDMRLRSAELSGKFEARRLVRSISDKFTWSV